MSGRPTARSDVRQRRIAGWPTAREGHGHGAPTVVVGVTPYQGGQESCPQGEAASREDGSESPPVDKEEAGQVLAVSERRGMRDADHRNRTDVSRRQERSPSTGKPDAWKAGMSGLAEGPTEKGRKIPRRRPTLLIRSPCARCPRPGIPSWRRIARVRLLYSTRANLPTSSDPVRAMRVPPDARDMWVPPEARASPNNSLLASLQTAPPSL